MKADLLDLLFWAVSGTFIVGFLAYLGVHPMVLIACGITVGAFLPVKGNGP